MSFGFGFGFPDWRTINEATPPMPGFPFIVLNANGDQFLVQNVVLNAAGTPFEVVASVLDADGNSFNPI